MEEEAVIAMILFLLGLSLHVLLHSLFPSISSSSLMSLYKVNIKHEPVSQKLKTKDSLSFSVRNKKKMYTKLRENK